ncbi:MAG: hypothetical protein IKL19_01965 [Paludibacteraceae bacterium]|nr:hypothetical protein [Paludibacteraceae bacterium]
MADGFALAGRSIERGVEIGNGMVWGVNALINLPLKRYECSKSCYALL